MIQQKVSTEGRCHTLAAEVKLGHSHMFGEPNNPVVITFKKNLEEKRRHSHGSCWKETLGILLSQTLFLDPGAQGLD